MAEKLWNTNYLKIWTGNFLLNFSFTLIVPLLPLYLSETFGATNDTIGMALAGYTPKELLKMSEEWKPWRSYATVNIWNSLYKED